MTPQERRTRLGDLLVLGLGFLDRLARAERDLVERPAADDLEHAHRFVDAYAEITSRARESTPARFPEP